ncbi:MAG: Fe-S cluster domain-containing protein [Salinivirgaceae bacterium]|nr:Fe-S cluster domain-containing protein [Salinivirgaceae bacterium]MDD4745656.1 Fe-S cluster domain-containing protein [Salinivirgaceae bacterium]MDY0279304.1 Fe-S cluster domain-containing protein [Salinivirgaceae bacterium]
MSLIVLLSIITLCVIGVIAAVVLFYAAKKFKVYEDPRIDEVEALLPAANCGGCGFPGCRGFAEALVKADHISDMLCPVGGNETMKAIATVLGQDVKETVPMIAVVRCNGSTENRPKTSIFQGAKNCSIAHSLYIGETDCSYGCLGYGECVEACKFDAMYMDEKTGLPVIIEENCVACGACVKACPRSIIEMRKKGPKSRRIYVSCVSCDKGAIAKKACDVACIACGKCVKACPHDAITIENNLAYIDFNKCKLCRKCVDVCPTHAIVELNFPPKKITEDKETTSSIIENI